MQMGTRMEGRWELQTKLFYYVMHAFNIYPSRIHMQTTKTNQTNICVFCRSGLLILLFILPLTGVKLLCTHACGVVTVLSFKSSRDN